MTTTPALASIAALERRMGAQPGTLTGPELARAQGALEDASALARDVGGVPWDVDTVPPSVVTVVLTAARRVVENPDQLVSEAVGAYSYQRDRDAGTGVYLTEREEVIVLRAARGSGVEYGVGTVGVRPPPYLSPSLDSDTAWLTDVGAWPC